MIGADEGLVAELAIGLGAERLAALQAHGMELAAEAIAIGEAPAAHWLREEPQLVLPVVNATPAPKAEPQVSKQVDLFARLAGAE